MKDVTIDNYVSLAVRTEAPITPEILDRLTNPVIAEAMMGWFETLAHAAKQLDHLKKFIFYGKELPATFQCLGSFKKAKPELLVANARLIHAVLGIASESGELISDQEKDGSWKGLYWFLAGRIELDAVNFLEECGDIMWYFALLCAVLNGVPIQVLQSNIDKLRTRYPEKFTELNALVRDLVAERTVLEGGAAVC